MAADAELERLRKENERLRGDLVIEESSRLDAEAENEQLRLSAKGWEETAAVYARNDLDRQAEVERLQRENKNLEVLLNANYETAKDLSACLRRIKEAARAALFTDPEDLRGQHRALEDALEEEA